MPEGGIWWFQGRVSTLLFNWNVINIAIGLMTGRHKGFWRGFGSQAVGWGVINVLIAGVGAHFGAKRRASLPDAESPQVFDRERANLRNVLWVNWALDMLYIWGGWRALRRAKPEQAERAGLGAGVMVQGLLLLLFDTWMLRELMALKHKPVETERDAAAD